MQITIKLMGLLKERLPAGGRLELVDQGTISDALKSLDIPVDTVQVFTVNGKLVRDQAFELGDGDELTVLPPVGGG